MACLCVCTWAWYDINLSESNRKLSGTFEIEVSITDSDNNALTVVEQANGSKRCPISTPGIYTATLKITEKSTVNVGFAIITVSGVDYSTSAIYKSDGGVLTFTIDATAIKSTTSLTFTSVRSTPSTPLIRQGDTLTVGAPTTK